MKTFVITIKGDEYSERVSNRCIESAKKHGLSDIKKFNAIIPSQVDNKLKKYNLKWTWSGNNDQRNYLHKMTGLVHFPYNTSDLKKKIACFFSHYELWMNCVSDNEDYLILEHDAVFINDFPHDIEYKGICQINDPNRATRKGTWWSNQMKQRGGKGVFDKTWIINPNIDKTPDGLAGNSAYLIKPSAAKEMIKLVSKYGIWPNDAIMCKQLYSDLEEYYPFITEVRQERSTTI